MTAASNDIHNTFDEQDLRIWVTFLRDYELHTDPAPYAGWYKSLASLKQKAVERNDQSVAKAIWCLETIGKIQEHFITAFQCLCSGKFAHAWDQFARCEGETSSLRSHFSDERMEFGVAFISTHTERFQQLFPLNLGTSPELIIEEVRCSICDTKITLRSDCGHQNGEIYNGELCVRNVTKAKVLGIALVHKPAQRGTMIFPEEDKWDQFSPLQHFAQSLLTPWRAWDYHKEERTSHHPAFKRLGRNDECACGSGVKYKRCCIDKDVVFPHYEVYLLD